MKKIRINELARELEVKPGVILEMLPELGVQEKKTHSSSIDEEVALELRRRLTGPDAPPRSPGDSAGEHDHYDYAQDEEDDSGHHEEAATPAIAEQRAAASAGTPEVSRVETPRMVIAPVPAPPAAPSEAPKVQPPRPFAPVAPLVRETPTQHAGPGIPAQEPSAPHAAPAEPERPIPFFKPLRPPLGGAVHPPLAHGGGHSQGSGSVSRNISIPARPLPPSTPRVGPSAPAPTPAGPRQPLPAEPARPSVALPVRPAPGASMPARPAAPSAIPQIPAPRLQHVPTHVVAPGPSAPAPSAAAPPSSPATPGHGPAPSPGPGSPAHASSVPGSPIPPRPAPPRPAGQALTPGAPIAPRPPQGGRQLAGQPQVRPIVPPRPDLVQRLKQQQAQQVRPTPAAPAMPRPGAPARPSSPAPGQPLYRGPVRPGQPLMRGPGQPGTGPMQPGGLRRPGGLRPMHPTSLRPDSPSAIPVEQPRRHQAKPGTRQPARKREDQEGNLRERVSKRQAIAEPPPIDREITVAEGITVIELSEKLGVKANMVIKKLVEKKIFATINQTLDVKLAEELAREFGASTNKVSYEEESTQDLELAEETKDLVRRAPVVTIMGHVDHGKTSLLDAIRQTNVAGREAGGITQHIGAYYIERNNRKIVFIDTPGHQAFTRMRARGAKVTDIVVLVVSADDGVMPQTLEAIDHAKAAGVPMIVAINKIDKPDAQPERVKQQLADRGLLAEDWGGDVVMVPVSAKSNINLDLLLEMILLVADLQDLKANPGRPALGTVLEAKLDKGRGPVATMLVRNGTLRVGDFFICGALFNKVRAMFDDRGNQVKEAEPSMPVEVIGLESLPEVGDNFQVVSDTSKAKQIVVYRGAKARDVAMAKGARVATLDSLHRQFKEGDLKDLNLIIKADVGGTAEVLSDTLQQLSNDKIRVRVLHAGVGAITESDVLLASAGDALVIGFNVKPESKVPALAEQQKVDIRQHNIIYELIDEVKLAMTGLLDPVYKETVQGHAEVRETFRISKVGTVAGCFVADGLIRRDSQVRLKRDGAVVHTGKIEALKRFKNDASEVKNGVECGISLVNFNDVNVGDVLEAFTMERIAPQLSQPA
ncbi:MAG TPA: translation initiation factor IF-2 [Bryobacteraceae bacterium]|nr:translation initiation factor IF-2 [Bryobacteraceae bacterium]